MLCCFVVADEFTESSTTLGGYGELHYDRESETLDFHRFIFYIKHTFDNEWSMMSEVEIEHNMVGSETALKSEGGYVALEQAYLNYWNGNWGFQGGVILVPAGITNEYHEPPTFMSVERPSYNKYIIPSTWFENGFAFYGKTGNVNWKYAMTGDMNGDGIDKGIRDGRDKGFKSSASDWTKTFQGSWTGMDGLKVGGSITMNDAPATTDADWLETNDCGAGQDKACNNEIIRDAVGFTLTEVNATYSKNNIYARMEYGSINYTDNVHVRTCTGADANANGLCDDVETENDDDDWTEVGLDEVTGSNGYYLDLGYNVADMVGCDGDLYVWTRTSEYSKDDRSDATEVCLFGVTFKPMENISIKLEAGEEGGNNVMRMGLGYMF